MDFVSFIHDGILRRRKDLFPVGSFYDLIIMDGSVLCIMRLHATIINVNCTRKTLFEAASKTRKPNTMSNTVDCSPSIQGFFKEKFRNTKMLSKRGTVDARKS